MALTNFAALTSEQLTVWSRDFWRAARNAAFISRFMGSDANSMIQRITELKKDEKGARAVITLIADLEGDGVAGDNQLEGNEEEIKSYDQVIRIDQLRHANRLQGRIADQKSVVTFRENSRDVLAYWVADRLDQLAFLTLAGEEYSLKTNGAARTGSALSDLDYAADVTAASTNRVFNWDGANGLVAASTTTDTIAVPTYDMFLDVKAKLQDSFIRPLRGEMGREAYNVFMTPKAVASLKKDTGFRNVWKDALARSPQNPLFQGTEVIQIDGFNIFTYRHVFNTDGLTSGTDMWGASNNLNGAVALFCGSQALGFADIGSPEWVEKWFDYDNQSGISIGKICGLLKPVFRSLVTGTDEDFGVMRINLLQ